MGRDSDIAKLRDPRCFPVKGFPVDGVFDYAPRGQSVAAGRWWAGFIFTKYVGLIFSAVILRSCTNKFYILSEKSAVGRDSDSANLRDSRSFPVIGFSVNGVFNYAPCGQSVADRR